MSIKEPLAHSELNCVSFVATADDFSTQGWVKRELFPFTGRGELPGNYLVHPEILASLPAGPIKEAAKLFNWTNKDGGVRGLRGKIGSLIPLSSVLNASHWAIDRDSFNSSAETSLSGNDSTFDMMKMS